MSFIGTMNWAHVTPIGFIELKFDRDFVDDSRHVVVGVHCKQTNQLGGKILCSGPRCGVAMGPLLKETHGWRLENVITFWSDLVFYPHVLFRANFQPKGVESRVPFCFEFFMGAIQRGRPSRYRYRGFISHVSRITSLCWISRFRYWNCRWISTLISFVLERFLLSNEHFWNFFEFSRTLSKR